MQVVISSATKSLGESGTKTEGQLYTHMYTHKQTKYAYVLYTWKHSQYSAYKAYIQNENDVTSFLIFTRWHTSNTMSKRKCVLPNSHLRMLGLNCLPAIRGQ